MGIELTIKIVSPMDDSDHEILRGVAVMVLAVADHELAAQRFPEAFPDDAEKPLVEEERTAPRPCAYVDPANPGVACVSAAGHRGRHRLRPLPGGPVLPN